MATTDSPRDAILIVDDEPDIHAVTKLSLKALKRADRRLEVLSASSGNEAVEHMRNNPDVAVILLDVVMESETAGLEACRRIRGELGNRLVRILLRTGQPGAAPERETIDGYDIDGYLAKAELTAAKVYSAVRTALRTHDEMLELDRHRRLLASVHDCVVALHSFEPLEAILGRIIDGAQAISGDSMCVLGLETMGEHGDSRRYALSRGRGDDSLRAEEIRARIVRARTTSSTSHAAQDFEGGLLIPLEVHRELGHGYLWVEGAHDALVRSALPVLAAHAANAVYASVAERILKAERGAVFDEVAV
jgi:CheY-like chemotaxis protein